MVLSRVLSGVPVRRSLVLFTQNGESLHSFVESPLDDKLDSKTALIILGSEYEGDLKIKGIVFQYFRDESK